jgi:hypothetical protein
MLLLHHSRVSVSKVFESHVLYDVHEVLVSRVNVKLLEDLDEDETKDELDGEVALLRDPL